MATSNKQLLKTRLLNLIQEIATDEGWEYVWMAIKRINDQQMFQLQMPALIPSSFEPIIMVLDNTTAELEHEIYNSENAIESLDELKDILESAIRLQIFPTDGISR